jgi:hypothetical protein
MGELSSQVLAGGPPLVPLADHPAIVEVMSTRFTGWELYRARELIRARFFRAMTTDYHLHIWARIEALGGPGRENMGEREARSLAGIIAGEWGVGEALGRAVADGIREYARGLSPETSPEFRAAVAALVSLSDYYAPAKA